MGKTPLTTGGPVDDVGANDNRALSEQRLPDMYTFRQAVNEAINYIRARLGKPCSTKHTGSQLPRTKRYVDSLFWQLCGHHLDDCPWYSDGLLSDNYELMRKKGDQIIKRQENIAPRHLPMFDGPPENNLSVMVYAYTARIATVRWRVVKIGYTADKIERYLASKRIQQAPILLGTTPGGKTLETRYKDHWTMFLVDGNEWFHPQQTLLQWLPSAYVDMVPNWRNIANAAHAEYIQLSQGE